MAVVLYGAGRRCARICQNLRQLEVEDLIIVDRNEEKWNMTIENYVVKTPEILSDLENVKLYITLADKEEVQKIQKNIRNRWGNKINEVSYRELILYALKNNSSLKQRILSETIDKNAPYNFIFDCYISGLGLGGVEEWTKDICQALIKSGNNRVYIVSKKGNYNVSNILKNKILYADRNDELYPHENIITLIDLIISKMPCKIIANYGDELLSAAVVVKRYFPESIQIYSVIHGGFEQVYVPYLEVKEDIDIFIGVSQDIKRDMIERGISEKKILTMTCPFHCEPLINRNYTLSTDEPIRIGYAGRMDRFTAYSKRMDLMLEFIKCLEERNVNFYMELAGDGPARIQLEQSINDNGLKDRVVFLGALSRSEIPDFWKRQDIYVSTSDCEGRCISTIEAMGNGVVPIVAQVSGTREDITDNENGFLVPIGDYKMMADRVRYLAEHRERLPEMGQKAHDVVYPKSLMSEHLKFWETLLD